MQEQEEIDHVNRLENVQEEQFEDDHDEEEFSDDIDSDVFRNFDGELLEGLVELNEEARHDERIREEGEEEEESAYESEEDVRIDRGDGDLQPFETEIPTVRHISRTRPKYFKKRSKRTCWNEEERKKWRLKRSRSSINTRTPSPPRKRQKLSHEL